MLLPSRNWLAVIAREYGVRAGLDADAVRKTTAATFTEALLLLNLMPWHLRLLVGGVELAASGWCILDFLFHGARVNPARAMHSFEKWGIVAPPLLRLYRSVCAVSWFEQPEVLLSQELELPEQHQERFRQLRDKSS